MKGGGLGRRGELEGDTAAAAVAAIFLDTEIIAGDLRKEWEAGAKIWEIVEKKSG